jgi:hypothetical protein
MVILSRGVTDIILVHLDPIPSPGQRLAALYAPTLNIAFCLKPVVTLPKLIQGLVVSQVAS